MMTLKDLFFKKQTVQGIEERSCENNGSTWYSGSLQFNSQSSYMPNKAMLHSCVYRCVDLISSSVAELPLVVTKMQPDGFKTNESSHIVYTILNRKPNSRQDKFVFFKTLVINMLLQGNAYCWIKRDNDGAVKELVYVPSDMVNVISNNIFDEVKYQINSIKKLIPASDMIHFINIPDHDGIKGISTLQYAKRTMQLAFAELDTCDSFFRSGANKSGIIKSEKPITSEQEQQILSNWQSTFNGVNGTPNGVVLLKPGLSYESIQVSPADAQLLDSRKMTVIDICRFYGVSPSMAFDTSKQSYASVEAEMLSFLTNTLTPMLTKIENELNRKLWREFESDYEVKFDTSVILRTNKEALANYYKSMFEMSVLSPNEIRRELDLEPIEGGDNHFMQVNISTIDKISNQDLQDNQYISNQLKNNEED